MSEDEVFAFVLMPFSAEFNDIYRLGIKAAAQANGVRAERVDEQLYREGMLEQIFKQIEVADIIIADMSGKNPNVFFEAGYAVAKGKLCLFLTSAGSDIPFDLKHRRHIVYDSIGGLLDNLTQDIEWALKEIHRERASAQTNNVVVKSDKLAFGVDQTGSLVETTDIDDDIDGGFKKKSDECVVKVPTLPDSIEDALIVTWHKKAGDIVKRDEVLVDVETDKVVLEVPAAHDGLLLEIVQDEGTTVVAHQVIGRIAPA